MNFSEIDTVPLKHGPKQSDIAYCTAVTNAEQEWKTEFTKGTA